MALRVWIVGFDELDLGGRLTRALVDIRAWWSWPGSCGGGTCPIPPGETLPDTDVPVYESPAGVPPRTCSSCRGWNYVFADFCESVVAGRTALMDTADTLATMEADLAVREAAHTGERRAVGR